ncbi:MAG: hypothetical protein FWE61_06870 [Micrococcales bacterium]|nr:hypothetical protein [Micrococcales bacterium]
MQRKTRAALAGVLAIAASLYAGPGFGVPDDDDESVVDATCNTLQCIVQLLLETGGVGSGGGSGAKPVCLYKEKTIPCERIDPAGHTVRWSSEYRCYYKENRLVPPGEDDLELTFEERPGEKLVICVMTSTGLVMDTPLWMRNAWWIPDGSVSPAQLAQQAVEQMDLRAPQIGMTGGSPPDGMQIVGIPAWMWVADPGGSTTGPVTRVVSAGGITVSATARLDRTVWTMGDGAVVTCPGARAAGTRYEGWYDKQPSPTCGYTYSRTSAGQPDEAFTVIVTAYWVVQWSGGGQSGTINLQMSRNTPKQVGELQAIVIGRDGRR